MDLKSVSNSKILSNDTGLVTIGIIIMIIITLFFYNLYEDSKFDSAGKRLSVKNTIKNMCGLYPLIRHTVRRSLRIVDDTATKAIKKIKRRKEVFNIDNNSFTYGQAEKVCKAFGAKLATYNQVVTAHRNGANWCNYGWSANQMALYPIQEKFHEEVEKNPKTKGNCGKPGINGGRFENCNLKFGVNCYGYRPKGDPGKLIYDTDPIYKKIVKSENKDNMDKYKKLVNDKMIEIRPYNNEKWSRYSFKNSRYILSPKDPLNLVIEETLKDDDKDPRKFCRGTAKKENKDNAEEDGGTSDDEENGHTSDDEENNDEVDLSQTKDNKEESKLRNNKSNEETNNKQNNQDTQVGQQNNNSR